MHTGLQRLRRLQYLWRADEKAKRLTMSMRSSKGAERLFAYYLITGFLRSKIHDQLMDGIAGWQD